jgi:hypothetical protein
VRVVVEGPVVGLRTARYCRPVLSYLDAGTGSMIVAAFAGGAAGIAVLLRMYGHRLFGVFSKTHRARAEEAKAQLLGDGEN